MVNDADSVIYVKLTVKIVNHAVNRQSLVTVTPLFTIVLRCHFLMTPYVHNTDAHTNACTQVQLRSVHQDGSGMRESSKVCAFRGGASSRHTAAAEERQAPEVRCVILCVIFKQGWPELYVYAV